MNLGPVAYSIAATPKGYRCGSCGKYGCKLWREYHTFVEHTTLLCCDCAASDQGKDVSTIDDTGRRETDYGRTDQIGWRVPAVPTEDGITYWCYTLVPSEGVAWWRRLPTRAT